MSDHSHDDENGSDPNNDRTLVSSRSALDDTFDARTVVQVRRQEPKAGSEKQEPRAGSDAQMPKAEPEAPKVALRMPPPLSVVSGAKTSQPASSAAATPPPVPRIPPPLKIAEPVNDELTLPTSIARAMKPESEIDLQSTDDEGTFTGSFEDSPAPKSLLEAQERIQRLLRGEEPLLAPTAEPEPSHAFETDDEVTAVGRNALKADESPAPPVAKAAALPSAPEVKAQPLPSPSPSTSKVTTDRPLQKSAPVASVQPSPDVTVQPSMPPPLKGFGSASTSSSASSDRRTAPRVEPRTGQVSDRRKESSDASDKDLRAKLFGDRASDVTPTVAETTQTSAFDDLSAVTEEPAPFKMEEFNPEDEKKPSSLKRFLKPKAVVAALALGLLVGFVVNSSSLFKADDSETDKRPANALNTHKHHGKTELASEGAPASGAGSLEAKAPGAVNPPPAPAALVLHTDAVLAKFDEAFMRTQIQAKPDSAAD